MSVTSPSPQASPLPSPLPSLPRARPPSPLPAGAAPPYTPHVPMERTPRSPPAQRSPPPRTPTLDRPGAKRPSPPQQPQSFNTVSSTCTSSRKEEGTSDGEKTQKEDGLDAPPDLNRAPAPSPAEDDHGQVSPSSTSTRYNTALSAFDASANSSPAFNAPTASPRPFPVPEAESGREEQEPVAHARRQRPAPISVEAANANASAAPTEALSPRCGGFILAPASTDPFALIQCPQPAVSPAVLCRACRRAKDRKLKAGCGGATYCSHHWCGGCKREARLYVLHAIAASEA